MIATEPKQMFGRRVIYTDEPKITNHNVVEVLGKALAVHSRNQREIQYLWDYYRGKTPILEKRKEVRETINHKINVNRASEIVTFKRGYGFGEPIQYIRRGDDERLTEDINSLNEYMFVENKQAEDSSLGEWIFVCGLGIRMVLPNDDADQPIKLYTLDPRYSFVVRYKGLEERVVMGVKIIHRDQQPNTYCVYTDSCYYEIENGKIVKAENHALEDVPVFEYPSGAARLGSFEIALPLLDAINELESNRMDDIVQHVNSFLALLGGTLDEDTYQKLNDWKMLCLPTGVDAKYLSVAMQQTDVQVQANALYNAVLTVCGIPNRNGGSSTSDTGSAVILRDGWETAEAQMRTIENEFKRAERRFLKLVLRILRDTVGTKLSLKDIEIKFSRRNYDNLQTKSQVLATLLATNMVHPKIAFTHCGLFMDPEDAYIQSKSWWEANAKAAEEEKTNNESSEMSPV